MCSSVVCSWTGCVCEYRTRLEQWDESENLRAFGPLDSSITHCSIQQQKKDLETWTIWVIAGGCDYVTVVILDGSNILELYVCAVCADWWQIYDMPGFFIQCTWQPWFYRVVLCDPDLMRTLPATERIYVMQNKIDKDDKTTVFIPDETNTFFAKRDTWV